MDDGRRVLVFGSAVGGDRALLPRNQPDARRVDDRRVLSGIVHVLRSGARWRDGPAVYGPPTTIDNRSHRWSRRGPWQRMLQALAIAEPGDIHLIERAFCRLEDWRRIATDDAIAIAIVVIWRA